MQSALNCWTAQRIRLASLLLQVVDSVEQRLQTDKELAVVEVISALQQL